MKKIKIELLLFIILNPFNVISFFSIFTGGIAYWGVGQNYKFSHHFEDYFYVFIVPSIFFLVSWIFFSLMKKKKLGTAYLIQAYIFSSFGVCFFVYIMSIIRPLIVA